MGKRTIKANGWTKNSSMPAKKVIDIAVARVVRDTLMFVPDQFVIGIIFV